MVYNFTIAKHIDSGSHRKWVETGTQSFEVRNPSSSWDMLSADLAVDSQVAKSQRKHGYDSKTGMHIITQPYTRYKEAFISNPLYERLKLLVTEYNKCANRYKFFSSRISELRGSISDCETSLRSLNITLERVIKKYDV